MACNNGKKGLHSPYGMITDLNITYTGCSTTCNGEEIKPGMRLREMLDILIGDCAEGGPATWGDIIGNIEDQTDLVQFIQDNVPSVTWGNISGDITDQEDLVQFVQENGFSEDNVGTNLHLGEDGKLNVGVDVGVPGTTAITTGGVFPPDSGGIIYLDQNQLLLQSMEGGTSKAVITVNAGGIDLSNTAYYRNVGVGIRINRSSSNAASLNLVSGEDTILEAEEGYQLRLVGRTQGIISANSMGSDPQLNTLTDKQYVDGLIADLQSQITALEARVQALEDATP